MSQRVPDAKTVYIKGLPDKVPRAEMRRALYLYCAQFGAVLEVHVTSTRAVYGQAFVVFADLAIANNCRRVMHGTIFYNRTVQVLLAEKSSFLADPAERRRRDARRERTAIAPPSNAPIGSIKRPRDD